MSACLKCDKAKDNGEPFCFDCDPDGELGHHLTSPESKAKWEKARRLESLEKEVAGLKGDLQ